MMQFDENIKIVRPAIDVPRPTLILVSDLIQPILRKKREKWTYERIIRESKSIYGDQYDYSNLNSYIKYHTRTIIKVKCKICNEEWSRTIDSHINRKQGCHKCLKTKKNERWSYERFIKEAKEVHGDKYDYSDLDPQTSLFCTSKVPITCNICKYKWETQIRCHIYKKSNCPDCNNSARWTYEKFIKRVYEIHGDRYEYKNIENITNSHSDIIIKCKTCLHEWTSQPIYHITAGSGCRNCAKNLQWTLDRFLIRAKEIHGDKYDYSSVREIKNIHSKLLIHCNICNYVWNTTLGNHINNKRGCSSCKKVLPWTLDRLISSAKEIHKDRYDYSNITSDDIVTNLSCIRIFCNKCRNEWKTTINTHINSKSGCPNCRLSKGEIICKDILEELNVVYEQQYKINSEINEINKYKYDFCFHHNDIDYLLEYDGIQHFEYVKFFNRGSIENFYKKRSVDILKTNVGVEYGFKIIRIDYLQDTVDKIKSHIITAIQSQQNIYLSDEKMYEWLIL